MFDVIILATITTTTATAGMAICSMETGSTDTIDIIVGLKSFSTGVTTTG